MKIVDTFTFFNELDILEIRLNVLSEYVDHFVIVESTKTHSGVAKKLHFEENKERFSKFLPKIIYHVVDNDYGSTNPWAIEHGQRNSITNALDELDLSDDDVVLVSDVDEIPNPELFHTAFKYLDQYPCLIFNMTLYYGWMNMKCVSLGIGLPGNQTWEFMNTRVAKYELFKRMSVDDIRRYCDGAVLIGGWHWSYLNPETVPIKLKSFSHTEYDTPDFMDVDVLKNRLLNGSDLLNRHSYVFRQVELDMSYPQYVLDNKEKFKHLLL